MILTIKNMIIKEEKIYRFKELFFAVIACFVSISILIQKGNENFSGWFIMSISFGYLATFVERRIKIKKQKMILVILSYFVPITVSIYGLVFKLF